MPRFLLLCSLLTLQTAWANEDTVAEDNAIQTCDQLIEARKVLFAKHKDEIAKRKNGSTPSKADLQTMKALQKEGEVLTATQKKILSNPDTPPKSITECEKKLNALKTEQMQQTGQLTNVNMSDEDKEKVTTGLNLLSDLKECTQTCMTTHADNQDEQSQCMKDCSEAIKAKAPQK